MGWPRLARRFAAVAAVALWPVLAIDISTAPAGTAEAGSRVLNTEVDGLITPVVADYLRDAVSAAARGDYDALLVTLDTPGGLDSSMREIVQAFLGARTPIVVYVSPAGARAASAGMFITYAAHVAALAPSTTIGAATPVDLQGGEISDKVVNDAAAYAQAIATTRGRDVEFAVQAVRNGRAVAATEAVEIGAVDLIAADRDALLRAIDGQTVRLPDGPVTLRTRDAQVDSFELGLFQRLRQFLADPTVAFLFLSVGTLALIYELATPGVGAGGVVGAILIILALYSLSVLPVNVAGLALLVLAAGLFVAEVFAPGVAVFAVGGAIALALAGVLLFRGPFSLDRTVVLPTAAVVAVGAVAAGRLTWRARRAPPVSGLSTLVGREAVVRRVDGADAMVFVEGAWWAARSRTGEPLHPDQAVRVVEVVDLTLVVEPVGGQVDLTTDRGELS